MSYIQAYKRLEKLCGDVLNDERRVSAYIDEMLGLPNGSRLVPNWDRDLKQLKHYRWIRNQIVHDPDCTEETMCEPADTQWIEEFHARIINRTDPLSLYRRATKSICAPKHRGTCCDGETSSFKRNKARKTERTKTAGCCAFFLFMFACFFVWLLMQIWQ